MGIMQFNHDAMLTLFSNRIQIWKNVGWKHLFKWMCIRESGFSKDVYDHNKRFFIRVSIVIFCFVYGQSEHIHVWRGKPITITHGDDDY